MFTVRGTKKLLERLKTPVSVSPPPSSTSLGDWYATVLFWKPQVALFVNETTFFPVFMPLAPANRLLTRFPTALVDVLHAAGVDPRFVATETGEMGAVTVAKTANRQAVGVMNELAFMAAARVAHGLDPADFVGLSLRVADTLVSPLYKPADGPGSPDRALARRVAELLA